MRLRLDGHTVADTASRTGLSAPTVSAAWKAFREGGWQAVPVRPRGRKRGESARLGEAAQQALETLLASPPPAGLPGWSSRALADALGDSGHGVSPRAVEHWLTSHGLKPQPVALESFARLGGQAGRWYRHQVLPVLESVRRAHGAVWMGGVQAPLPQGADEPRRYQLYLHGKRGLLYTRCLPAPPLADDYLALFERLIAFGGEPLALVFHGACFQACRAVEEWLEQHPEFRSDQCACGTASSMGSLAKRLMMTTLTHLQRLEAESIQIMREVVAETENPVMLYSVGKDSAVMLHLARKAFAPSPPPFPLTPCGYALEVPRHV